MSLTKLNMSPANGVIFQQDKIDYYVANDPVYYEVDNRPLKNLAARDNLIAAAVDAIIDAVNNSYNGDHLKLVSDPGHVDPKDSLELLLATSLNADGSLKAAAIPQIANTDKGLRNLQISDVIGLESRAALLRTKVASGFRNLPTVVNNKNLDATAAVDAVGKLAPSSNLNNLWLGKTTINAYGYELNILQANYANGDKKLSIIPLNAAPMTGVRQDIAFIEVWREIAHPIVSSYDGVGNGNAASNILDVVGIDLVTLGVTTNHVIEVGAEFYKVSSATLIGDDTRLVLATPLKATLTSAKVTVRSVDGHFYRYGNAQYMGSAFGDATSQRVLQNGSAWYATGSINVTIDPTSTDVASTVGLSPDGFWTQVRYRIRVVDGLNMHAADTLATSVSTQAKLGVLIGGEDIKAQGDMAVADDGIFYRAGAAGINDYGVFIAETSSNFPLSSSAGVVAIPLCIVHRRNQTAWSITNLNGAKAAATSESDRPDGLFFDAVDVRDILDIRNYSNETIDYHQIFDATMHAIQTSTLNTYWEEQVEDTDGNESMVNPLGIFGTKLLRAEGIKAVGFESSYDIQRRGISQNGLDASPDGLRYIWDDAPSTMQLNFYIPNVGIDGVTPTLMYSYNQSSKTIACDITDFTSFADESEVKPIFDGSVPSLFWEDGKRVNILWGDLSSSTITGVIQDGNTTIAEGHVSHANQAIFGSTNVHFPKGGSFLSTMPELTSNSNMNDAIKGTQITINNVSLIPTNGIGYAPIGQAQTKRIDTRLIRGNLVAANAINGSALLKIDATYHAWYATEDGVFHATSSNGHEYHNHQAVTGISTDARNLHVIKDGANIVLFFNDNLNVSMATSTDGVAFTASTVIATPSVGGFSYDVLNCSAPSVIVEGTTYRMWFVGDNKNVCFMESADQGTTWGAKSFVFSLPTVGRIDLDQITSLCVIKEGGLFRMWYGVMVQDPDGLAFHGIQEAQGKTKLVFVNHHEYVSERYGVLGETATGYAAMKVIKDGIAYRCTFTDKGDGSVHFGLLGISDSDNSGTSTIGVYTTKGKMNASLGQNDSIVCFYEAPANQNFRLLTEGSEVTLKNVFDPDEVIVSSVGTGRELGRMESSIKDSDGFARYFGGESMQMLDTVVDGEYGDDPYPFVDFVRAHFASKTRFGHYRTGLPSTFVLADADRFGASIVSMNGDAVISLAQHAVDGTITINPKAVELQSNSDVSHLNAPISLISMWSAKNSDTGNGRLSVVIPVGRPISKGF